ncbi:MAG: FAD:protein FMN transferase, partial [Actinomycetota bacterium]
MASPLELVFEDDGGTHDEAWSAVLHVFAKVEDACSRFRDQSALATYLAAEGPSTAPPVLVEVLAAAFEAYRVTNGRFDPRVRSSLEALGYDQNFAQMVEPELQAQAAPVLEPWEDPVLDRELCLLRPARASLDLGGIGKGAALELARFQL